MLKKLLFVGTITLASVCVAYAKNQVLIDGTCNADSHTTEGPIGSDLTKRQSRFYCDAAFIFYYNDSEHLLVQFIEKESHHPQVIGFGGRLVTESAMIVEHAYLGSGGGKPITVGTDSYCSFHLIGKEISSIFCGMHVDETGRRTVAIVDFDARRPNR